jgi:hypothetical protein
VISIVPFILIVITVIMETVMYFLTFSCWYQGVDMFGERIGFLKFKADIFDKETGKKVCGHLHALF